MTAFAEVVATWSEQSQFLLNVPFYNRELLHPDVDRLVGDFTTLVLLAVDVGGDGQDLAAKAQRLQEQLRRDAQHIDYSGIEVLRDLARARQAPVLAPVVFTSTLNMGELFTPRVGDAFGDAIWTMSQVPQTLLDCQAIESDNGDVLLNWDVVDGVFEAGVLEAMFEGFVGLVGRLAGGDWSGGGLVPLGQLAVRERVNATSAAVVSAGLHEGFFGWAAREPGRVAVVGAGAGDGVTYGELAGRALRIAGTLAARGVTDGDRVAVSLPKGADQLAAVLGVLAAGGVYVPVAVDQPPARRARMLRACDARAAVVADGDGWDLDAITILDALAGAPAPAPASIDVDALAYVIFTSGSTGEPKGVMVTHRAAHNTIADIAARFALASDDRVLAVSGLDFDLSVFDLFGLLSAGGALVVPHDHERRDAARLLQLCDEHHVTVWNSVPALLEMAATAATATHWPPTVRLALASGDWVPVALGETIAELSNRACRFVALGGATEAAIWSNYHDCTRPLDPTWRSAPYGQPLTNQRFRVVDHHGNDRPDWVPGELWIGGAGLAAGYAGDPTLTATKFVDHHRDRWYRTGDLGRYRPDGTLEFLGRRDTQIKLRGHRIELGEIEAALRTHPNVRHAAATITTTPTPRITAFVTPTKPNHQLDPAELHQHAAQHLPPYMLPARIHTLDHLPLTANQKLDRNHLHTLATTLATTTTEPSTDDPPQTPTETLIATTWTTLLNHPTIHRNSNFFTLGGDSLLATRLLTELRAAGVRGATLRGLLEGPTLQQFAATLTIDDHGITTGPQRSIEPDEARRFEPFALTEVQRAYLLGREDLFALGGVGAHSYWEFDATGIDADRLRAAVDAVVARHDMLRAVCAPDGTQRVLESVPPFDLRVDDVGDNVYRDAVERLRADLGHQLVDVSTWPTFDIRVIRAPSAATVGISLDHIVFDAMSAMMFLEELSAFYVDPTAALPSHEITFRDYVLAAKADPEAIGRARAYWCEQLDDLPPAPTLPTCVDLETVRTPVFTRHEARIAAATWRAFRENARRVGLSSSALLAFAYAETLSLWSANPDLTLLCTVFDRRPLHPDVDQVIGDFTSLVLVPHRSTGDGLQQAAKRFQESLWGALDHSAMSALQVLRDAASRSGAPVQVPFVFTSALGVGTATDPLSPSFGAYAGGISQTPQVLLDCQVFEHRGELVLNWDVVDGVFEAGVLEAMFEGFVGLVGRLAGGDWSGGGLVPLGQLAVRERVNATSAAVVSAGLHEGFFGWAAREPGRVAVVGAGAGDGVTYGELAGRALRIAGTLAARGVTDGDRVAVSLPKGADQLAAVLGVLAAGGVYVPVAVDQPPARRARMLRACDARAAVVADGDGWDLDAITILDALGRRARPCACLDRCRRARLCDLHVRVDRRTQGRDGHPPRRRQHHRRHRCAFRACQRRPRPRRVRPRLRPLGVRPVWAALSRRRPRRPPRPRTQGRGPPPPAVRRAPRHRVELGSRLVGDGSYCRHRDPLAAHRPARARVRRLGPRRSRGNHRRALQPRLQVRRPRRRHRSRHLVQLPRLHPTPRPHLAVRPLRPAPNQPALPRRRPPWQRPPRLGPR